MLHCYFAKFPLIGLHDRSIWGISENQKTCTDTHASNHFAFYLQQVLIIRIYIPHTQSKPSSVPYTLQFDASEYAADMLKIKDLSKEEIVTVLRRSSINGSVSRNGPNVSVDHVLNMDHRRIS